MPLLAADPATFTGTAFIRLLAGAESECRIKLYYVRFERNARTWWHAHEGVQILTISQGCCRYQRESEPVREAVAGESVRFEPGVRHWHGAAEEQTAEHIAVNLEVRETRWMEEVSDTDYRAILGKTP
ncbi:MAG: cupin domain-containing protein [Gemmatimonadota bacterium]|nr:cupin domain-containing protein [Gemmatimonadota bacterium]